jgi:hypothetical protein
MRRILFSVAVVLLGSGVAFSQGVEQRHPIKDRDSFEFTTLEREQPILDSFARGLLLEGGRKGYILVYAGRISCEGEAKRVIELIEEHMADRHGLERGRIVGMNGGYRERTTYEMWSVPKGEAGPIPTPTVDPSEVKFLRPNNPRCKYLRTSRGRKRRS